MAKFCEFLTELSAMVMIVPGYHCFIFSGKAQVDFFCSFFFFCS